MRHEWANHESLGGELFYLLETVEQGRAKWRWLCWLLRGHIIYELIRDDELAQVCVRCGRWEHGPLPPHRKEADETSS